MTREQLFLLLKKSGDLEQLLEDLMTAKQTYDNKVADLLLRGFDDE